MSIDIDWLVVLARLFPRYLCNQSIQVTDSRYYQILPKNKIYEYLMLQKYEKTAQVLFVSH